MQEKHYISACGLYCGLCPRFQSTAKSKCLGCQLGENHDYCSLYRCCHKKHGHFTCAECKQYPCEKLIRVLGIEEGIDSFISHKQALPNLDRIREVGMDKFLDEQKGKRLLVEVLINEYNDGRSMTFYCAACTLMPPEYIERAIDAAIAEIKNKHINKDNIKTRVKLMRSAIQQEAEKANIDIKLRKVKRGKK